MVVHNISLDSSTLPVYDVVVEAYDGIELAQTFTMRVSAENENEAENYAMTAVTENDANHLGYIITLTTLFEKSLQVPFDNDAVDPMESKMRSMNNAWVLSHPNFCRACKGYGMIHEEGSRSEPSYDEPCACCVEENKCPLCAGVLTTFTIGESKSEYRRCDCCNNFDEFLARKSNESNGMPDPWFGYNESVRLFATSSQKSILDITLEG